MPTNTNNIRTNMITALTSILIAVITTYGTIVASGSKIEESKSKVEGLDTKIETINKELKDINGKLYSRDKFPIGTIIASVLPPDKFAKTVGDPLNFDSKKSKWRLADNIGALTGTDFSQLTNNMKIPDMRGVFLRGQNFSLDKERRNDGYENVQDIIVGRAQKYSTAKPNSTKFGISHSGFHNHKISISGSGSHKHSLSASKSNGTRSGAPLGHGDVHPGEYKEFTSGVPDHNHVANCESRGIHSHEIVGWDLESRPSNVTVFFYIRIND